MQFPIEQLPQRSPVDAALNSYLKMQQAMAAPEQMKMQRAMQQENLRQAQLANQYYAPNMDASLLQKQLMNKQLQEKLKYMPMDELLNAMRIQNQMDQVGQSQARFNNPAYLMSKTFGSLPTAEKTNVYGQIAQPYNQLLASQGNAALAQAQGSPQAGGTPQQNPMNQMLAQIMAKTYGINPNQLQGQPAPQGAPLPASLQISPQQQAALAQSAQQGGNPLSIQVAQAAAQQQGQPNFNMTPEQMAQTQRYAQLQANRGANSANLNARIDAGEAVENLVMDDDVQKGLATITKYPGLMGKAKSEWDKRADPGAYADYQNAVERIPIIISGSLKGLEGLPTSSEGMRAGIEYLKAASTQQAWKQDPAAAAKSFVLGYKLLQDEQNALLKTGQKAYPNVIPQHTEQPQILQNIASGQMSPQQAISQPLSIGQTLAAQNSGKSSAAPAKINEPTFNSKAEFRDWYNSLSPAEKAAYKQRKMSGQ